jgi:hypothetical protein
MPRLLRALTRRRWLPRFDNVQVWALPRRFRSWRRGTIRELPPNCQYLLVDEVAKLIGCEILVKALHESRPAPLALFIGALAAGMAAKQRNPPPSLDIHFFCCTPCNAASWGEAHAPWQTRSCDYSFPSSISSLTKCDEMQKIQGAGCGRVAN